MSREYTITISGVASPAAAFDFAEINAGTNKPVDITRIRIAQTSEATTEEEQIPLTIVRGHTTSGSGGDTTPDGGPSDPNNTQAAGYTAETMNTTIASAGTPINIFEDAWNTRSGCDIALAPEEVLGGINGSLLVIRSGAPVDAVTIRATIFVRER